MPRFWPWLAAALLLRAACAGRAGADRSGLAAALPELADLRRSVLRISVYRRLFHWSRPFDDHDVTGSLGSGFFISEDPPTVCTCAHVVAGAEDVYVQVTEFGRTKFAARVATIDYDTDAAILLLSEPQLLREKLGRANISLQPLKLASRTPPLGHSVVAPGFPLGQESLTLSTGVISGVDHVDFHHRNLALQSTAIISPGNSGSPLLDAESREVIGMNYAKLTGEAQINYAVALWRLKQVIRKHEQVYAGGGQNRTAPYQLRVVDHGLVTTPGQDALYLRSRGGKACSSGPLISGVAPDSPFRDAEPPAGAGSFLVSVDGVPLDRYGQGSKGGYVEELVDFDDLLAMRGGTGEEDVEFETCNASTGQVRAHRVSLAWRKDRQGRGVRYVHDARVEQVGWEIFGDLLFMDLSENHVKLLGSAALYHLLEPEARQQPRLAVLLLRDGGPAQEALGLREGAGLAIVDSVNGRRVGSLEELRRCFVPEPLAANGSSTTPTTKLMVQRRHGARESARASLSTFDQERQALLDGKELLWSMRTETGREYAALFAEALRSQAASAKKGSRYVLTAGAKAAMEKLGLLSAPAAPTASLLGGGQRRLRSAARLADNPEAAPRMGGQPLESVRREPGSIVVDYAQGEGFNVW